MIPSLDTPRVTLNDLQYYLAIGLKHIRLMALLMCLALTAGLAYYVFRVPVYYARALIEVKMGPPKEIDAEVIYQDSKVDFVRAELDAPHIVERTARKFGIRASVESIRRNHMRKFRALVNTEGNIDCQIYATSPDLTRAWAETALDVFLEYRDEQRMEKREGLVKTYGEEMARIRQKIEEFAVQASTFVEANRLEELRVQLSRQQALPAELADAKARLAKLEDARDAELTPGLDVIERLSILSAAAQDTGLQLGDVVGAATSPQEVRTAAPAAATDEDEAGQDVPATAPAPAETRVVVVPTLIDVQPQTWQILAKERVALVEQDKELNRVYLPDHPKRAETRKKLEDLDKALRVELVNLEKVVDVEHARLMQRQADLDLRMPQYTALRSRYDALLRAQEQSTAGHQGWQAVYKQMARRLGQFDLRAEDERSRFQYAGLIQSSEFPASPNRFKLVLMSLALGLGLCLAVPFLIEYLDHTVTMVDKAERSLGLHGLGIVPLLGATQHGALPHHHRRLLATDHAGHRSRERSLLESFRVIRANIQGNRDLPAARQVIMVTSSIPREGKSMISSNLATSFARLGEKTLVIDADIRRGALHRNFNVQRQPGLSALLRHQVSLDRCIVHTAQANLDIIPVGRNSSGAAESLASGTMQDLIAELRPRYQRIVVDTPPVLGISETCDMLRCVDGVLLVIWSGYTPVHQIRTAVDMLVDNGANMFGFILNRLDLSTATNYYYYFYYSDYYYKGYHHERLPPGKAKEKNVTPAEDSSELGARSSEEEEARSAELGARSAEQGARSAEQGARSTEQGAGSAEQEEDEEGEGKG